MKMKIIAVVIISISSLVSFSHQGTQYCSHGYCEYVEGSTKSKIIISASHGGTLKPNTIRDRTYGCLQVDGKTCVWTHDCEPKLNATKCKAKTSRDLRTQEIARELAKHLKDLTGEKPYLIINHLHRSKMDGNREIGEATFNEPLAVKAYEEFHNFIAHARSSVIGNGLFLDIHGQTHERGWQEFGYLFSKSTLNNAVELDANKSSIRSLASRYDTTQFESILRGEKSLGHYLEQQNSNYDAVPSPKNPKPGIHGYFSGGYNTRVYGSKVGGSIDGIQVEANSNVRKRSEYKSFSENLAKAVKAFMDEHY